MRVSVWVRRDTVDRGSPQRLEISKLPSRASWPSRQRKTSNARDTTWITSPSPARSLASIPCLLSRSERRPMVVAIHSAVRNKIPLAGQATSGNLRPQQKAVRKGSCPRDGPENGMPDIKIVTEVAGRVCALPVEVGGSVGDGDDVAFVEAMKMEIPVASPAAGKLKSILVNLDDVVAEGQVLAIVEI